MAVHGAALFAPGDRVLTHCNAGALATGGIGTAVGVIAAAHRAGKVAAVWVDETRPLLQGARLTAWELLRLGIPHRLVTDSMVGALMSRGLVERVIVGADRIAANGDAANKIGTYTVAVLAHRHEVPFYVAAPLSTFDSRIASGAAHPDRGARRPRGHRARRPTHRADRNLGLQSRLRRHAGGAHHGDRDRGGRPRAAVHCGDRASCSTEPAAADCVTAPGLAAHDAAVEVGRDPPPGERRERLLGERAPGDFRFVEQRGARAAIAGTGRKQRIAVAVAVAPGVGRASPRGSAGRARGGRTPSRRPGEP